MKIMDRATQLEEVVAGRDAEAATIRTVLIHSTHAVEPQ